ncbi:MAG: hypothetical protein QM754_10700 [Tepidisphaeraceae bacterium]
MDFLRSVGIDIWAILAFFIVNAVSVFVAAPTVGRLHWLLLCRMRKQGREERPVDVDNARNSIRNLLELEVGGIIGCVERAIFIYAVMVPAHFGVLTAVVILKAFFGWIKQPTAASEDNTALPDDHWQFTSSKTYKIFAAYIFGNCCSILAGLLLGHVAIIITKLLTRLA